MLSHNQKNIPCRFLSSPSHVFPSPSLDIRGENPQLSSQDLSTYLSATPSFVAFLDLQCISFRMLTLLHFQISQSQRNGRNFLNSPENCQTRKFSYGEKSPNETDFLLFYYLTEVRCKNRGDRLPILKSKDITISLGHTQMSTRETALQDAKGN